jgi:hypothetical protein
LKRVNDPQYADLDWQAELASAEEANEFEPDEDLDDEIPLPELTEIEADETDDDEG